MADQTHDTDDEVTRADARRALELQRRFRHGRIEGYAEIYNQTTGLLAIMNQYSHDMKEINRQRPTQNPREPLFAIRDAAIDLAEADPDAVRETLEAADR